MVGSGLVLGLHLMGSGHVGIIISLQLYMYSTFMYYLIIMRFILASLFLDNRIRFMHMYMYDMILPFSKYLLIGLLFLYDYFLILSFSLLFRQEDYCSVKEVFV